MAQETPNESNNSMNKFWSILKKILSNVMDSLRLLLPGKDSVSRWSFGMGLFSMMTLVLTVGILLILSTVLFETYYVESYKLEVNNVSNVCREVIRQTRDKDAGASDSVLFSHLCDSLQKANLESMDFFCILDSQLTVIASEQHPELKGSNMFVNVRDTTQLEAYMTEASFMESNLWNMKFMSSIKLDDTDRLVSLSHLSDTPGWSVAAVSSEDTGGLPEVASIIVFISFASIGICLLGNILMFFFMRRSERKRRIVQSEIDTAASLQQKMVPKKFPTHELFQLHGMLKPAKDMGGDLYDFVMKDGRLIFCLGDVSGKGMPAALIMSTLHSSFRAAVRRSIQPDEIATYINEAVAADNETMMFCTYWVGVYTPETGELAFCNAGHNAPVLIETDGQAHYMEVGANLPLGIIEDFPYQQQSITLSPGSALLVYTDGVTEAMDINHQQFGDETLLVSTNYTSTDGTSDSSKRTAESIIKKVYHDVRHHAHMEDQSDDITMLCLKRNTAQS